MRHRLRDSDSSAFGTPDGAPASNNILCMLSESERSLTKHWRRLRQIGANYFRRFRATRTHYPQYLQPCRNYKATGRRSRNKRRPREWKRQWCCRQWNSKHLIDDKFLATTYRAIFDLLIPMLNDRLWVYNFHRSVDRSRPTCCIGKPKSLISWKSTNRRKPVQCSESRVFVFFTPINSRSI